MAGSFTSKVGGHNVLEPADYGVLELFGPYMYSQPELEHLMLEAGGGRQVNEEELGGALADLLSNREERERMGAAALELTKRHRGATECTWKELHSLMGDV